MFYESCKPVQIFTGPTLVATHIGPCLCLTGPTLDSAGPALVAAQQLTFVPIITGYVFVFTSGAPRQYSTLCSKKESIPYKLFHTMLELEVLHNMCFVTNLYGSTDD